ncbi:NINE protein [Brachybacterium sp.]|uniref:NINE protein n=1 Tax=Brachybacterium sp. TaxID=1891286 RepID=UPI003F8E6378
MSTPGDHGSWNPQGHDYGAQHGAQPPQDSQDPWAQPPASQDPYGQPSAGSASDPFGQQPGGQDPYGQPSAGSASDPYGQYSAGSASHPYGQGQQGWSAAGPGPSASDPFGQPAAAGPPPQGQPQSRLVVGLLGIFLGGLGVHRFLLGYTTIGIIQIAVTVVTCGVGAWWGVIEGIMVLAKSPSFERDAHGRPLTD